MLLSDIISNTDVTTSAEVSDIDIKSITTNAEIEAGGCLYVSLHSDAEREARAIKCGCCAILCEGEERDYGIPVLYTENVRRAYALLAKRQSGFSEKKTRLIGVTGTNGKTTVATVIYEILNKLGHKCGFIGTGRIAIPERVISEKFYSMTTPDPNKLYSALREMNDADCEFAVMEVSSHSLYFEKVSPLRFAVSVFTNLSSEHMDFHKNMTEYYLCKKRLTELTDKTVINMDDFYGRRLYSECMCEKIGVGAVYEGDVRIKSINVKDFSGTEYLYYGKDFVFIAKTALFGLVNVYNTALALCAVTELGVKPYLAKRALAGVEAVSGRFEMISENPTVIIDYAHTPGGLECFMKGLCSFGAGRKVTLIFGAGGDRDKEKRPKMAEIAEKYADKIIVTTDNPRGEDKASIINDITAGFSPNAKYRVIADRAEAIATAIGDCTVGEIIAIVGKGCEGYIIDKEGYRPYSDKATAIAALKLKESEDENES